MSFLICHKLRYIRNFCAWICESKWVDQVALTILWSHLLPCFTTNTALGSLPSHCKQHSFSTMSFEETRFHSQDSKKVNVSILIIHKTLKNNIITDLRFPIHPAPISNKDPFSSHESWHRYRTRGETYSGFRASTKSTGHIKLVPLLFINKIFCEGIDIVHDLQTIEYVWQVFSKWIHWIDKCTQYVLAYVTTRKSSNLCSLNCDQFIYRICVKVTFGTFSQDPSSTQLKLISLFIEFISRSQFNLLFYTALW